MPELYEFLAPGPTAPTAVHGRVANTPSADDELFVTIETFDGHRQWWGPCRYPGGAHLQRGDDVLIVFDERGEEWVAGGFSGGGSGGNVDGGFPDSTYGGTPRIDGNGIER